MALLVAGIVKHHMDGLACICNRNFLQHLAYLRGCNIAVVRHSENLLRGIVHRAQHVVTHAARKCLDESTCLSVNVTKEIASHDKVGCVQEQQCQLISFRFLHEWLKNFIVELDLLLWICLCGK